MPAAKPNANTVTTTPAANATGNPAMPNNRAESGYTGVRVPMGVVAGDDGPGCRLAYFGLGRASPTSILHGLSDSRRITASMAKRVPMKGTCRRGGQS